MCEANPEAVLELAADGQLIAMTPTGGDTSARNSLLGARLQVWALGQGGWKVFDSSGGFRLPDGSVLSPDASVDPAAPVARQRIEAAEMLEGGELLPGLRLELAEIWAG